MIGADKYHGGVPLDHFDRVVQMDRSQVTIPISEPQAKMRLFARLRQATMSYLKTHSTVAPSAPPSGSVEYWTNSVDGQLWYTNSLGNSYPVAHFSKDIEGTIYVDPANTQGWSGGDAGAWINSANSYAQTTYNVNYGAVIQLAPGTYTQTTPVLIATLGWSIILRGSGDGNGGTILNFTSNTANAIAVTLGGASGNNGGVQLENITVNCGASSATTLTAVQWGATAAQTGGSAVYTAGATAKNVAINKTYGAQQFAMGMNWANSAGVGAYGVNMLNVKVQYCTTGMATFGENNVIIGGLIGNCGTGITVGSGTEVNAFAMAFDDNTTTAVNVSNIAGRVNMAACRFENPSQTTTSSYITISAGTITLNHCNLQDDNTTGTATGFIQCTGGTVTSTACWHTTSGRTFTQIYNVTAPGQVVVNSPVIAPGATFGTAVVWFTPGVGVANARIAGYNFPNSLTAALGTINTTETLLLNLPLPAGGIRVGTTIRWIVGGTFTTTTTTAQTTQFFIRSGTLGTTGDTLNYTLTTTNGTTALTSQPFKVFIEMTCTAVGSASTWMGMMYQHSPDGSLAGAQGFQGLVSTSWTLGTAPNTITATFMDLSVKTSATTDSITAVTEATAEWVRV
jgi:hypothetical protein